MFGLGATEVVVLLVIALLLFGKQLPGLARWLGQSVVEFRRETRALTEDFRGSSDSYR